MKFSLLEWIPFQPWRIASVVDAADEIPEQLPPKCAILVGTADYPKWLAFDCPCKQGHRIMVPLDRNKNPHWTLQNAQRLTLTPSVDAWRGTVRCHYILNDGRVHWVPKRGWLSWF